MLIPKAKDKLEVAICHLQYREVIFKITNCDLKSGDIMVELTKEEYNNLRSQFGSSSWGGSRYLPMAFTEQGVAMLSGILNSKRAIQVNIQIMRTFTKLRHMIAGHEELKKAVDELREQTDERFEVVFSVLDKLLADDEKPKKKIGF